jgi:hypothetical protein
MALACRTISPELLLFSPVMTPTGSLGFFSQWTAAILLGKIEFGEININLVVPEEGFNLAGVVRMYHIRKSDVWLPLLGQHLFLPL